MLAGSIVLTLVYVSDSETNSPRAHHIPHFPRTQGSQGTQGARWLHLMDKTLLRSSDGRHPDWCLTWILSITVDVEQGVARLFVCVPEMTSQLYLWERKKHGEKALVMMKMNQRKG